MLYFQLHNILGALGMCQDYLALGEVEREKQSFQEVYRESPLVNYYNNMREI